MQNSKIIQVRPASPSLLCSPIFILLLPSVIEYQLNIAEFQTKTAQFQFYSRFSCQFKFHYLLFQSDVKVFNLKQDIKLSVKLFVLCVLGKSCAEQPCDDK